METNKIDYITQSEREFRVARGWVDYGKPIGWNEWIQTKEYKSIPPAILRDEYHTMDELYEYRMIYNACLFNEWSALNRYEVHKSIRHHDGELCFGGGWFIVVAILPTGQISNHYKLEHWDLFRCEEIERAKYEWDGHTPNDVLIRLKSVIPPAMPIEIDKSDNTYYDLSKVSDDVKKSTIQEFMELTAFHALKLFLSLGLETHMECMVINQVNGEEFILSFKKLIDGKVTKTEIVKNPTPAMPTREEAKALADEIFCDDDRPVPQQQPYDHFMDGFMSCFDWLTGKEK